MTKKYLKDHKFSTDEEPCLNNEAGEKDPSENNVFLREKKRDEIFEIQDSVYNEPWLENDVKHSTIFTTWVENKKTQYSISTSLLFTFIAALLSGPFAIIGAIFSGRGTIFSIAYVIVFAPVIEELLKTFGMVYLLEKKPYHIRYVWQIILGAMIGGLFFAIIENLIYTNFYLINLDADMFEKVSAFRWKYCTLLHVFATFIASLGLVNIWKRMYIENKFAELKDGYKYFIIAMIIHGSYNLFALVADKFFF
ncbi:MAG: PrsW family intramembrane metalloprotease [Candidatus Cloacimonetes bacterium]|nr:PrsW family intramembrane metalloprotease [Candidatus Cloacimonadota bacterium]